MEEKVKAGLKAGILCGVASFVIDIASLLDTDFFLFFFVDWLFLFAPGILAIHFGKAAIKNRRDVIESTVVAGLGFHLCSILLSAPFFISQSTWSIEMGILIIFFSTVITLPFILGISIVGGLLYAKLRLGVPLGRQKTQKTVPSGARPPPYQTHCPRCRNRIDRTWISCPYCGYDLRDDTRIYDDKTRIY